MEDRIPLRRDSGARAVPRRVFVINDDRAQADTWASVILSDGHTVRVEHSGLAAVVALDEFRPDVVLLSIAMPGMSGFGIASRVRKTAWGRHAVLVAVTDLSDPLLRQRLTDFRFNAALPTSPGSNELRRVLMLAKTPESSDLLGSAAGLQRIEFEPA